MNQPPAEQAPTQPQPGPESPSDLPKRGWWGALKRTIKQFQDDNLTDWAAALTYYGVLSIFPGLLVLVSSLGFLGESTAKTVTDTLQSFMPPVAKPIIGNVINGARQAPTGLFAILGLLGALWSASGYIGAFMRAVNAIYDVPEGRPFWKTLPLRLGLTVLVGVLLVVSALTIVMTGRLAQVIGNLLHLGHTAVVVWDIAKWPVLLLLISLAFGLLYYLAPNARHTGFRWITPGSLVAVVVWAVASVGFGLYLSNFASYNKTYGTLGGAIAFLVWLWISNIALLMGAELDAELERERAIEGGMRPKDKEPYLPLRDDSKVKEDEHAGKNNSLG
ncbi:YihY/virulence factor BrkB family protein [Planosporangium mesophilum]|uniref:Ribonuclease n=1 Tax=Planosporangium mesophilum TaxID=689768 RepID=A0A8J3TEU0_9ACTN|nr:YihY/virulence factor BrkB family protein [Planosporangium mesophilum]NJC86016.1 YihY/virulence factor BrkB family protein [Planosporangium mesophilum]GII25523.1 ribonuclease [Planosporangium mesophilum]